MSNILMQFSNIAIYKIYNSQDFFVASEWANNITYNAGDLVFFRNSFFTCKNNGTVGILPTDTNFYTEEVRTQRYVTEKMLENAFEFARANSEAVYLPTTPNLADPNEAIRRAFYCLVNHKLWIDSSALLFGPEYRVGQKISSKSVKDTSVSYHAPNVGNKPIPAFFDETKYGREYWYMVGSFVPANYVFTAPDDAEVVFDRYNYYE